MAKCHSEEPRAAEKLSRVVLDPSLSLRMTGESLRVTGCHSEPVFQAKNLNGGWGRVGLGLLAALILAAHSVSAEEPLKKSVAADGPVFELVASVKPRILTIGDEVKVTVEVLHAPEMRILELPQKLDLTPFELKRSERLPAKESGGAVAEGFRLTLTIFDLGEKAIPPIPVSFSLPGGSPKTVYTETIPVFIQSVGGAGAPPGTELKAIRGPKDLPGEKLLRWIWRVAAMILAIFALGLTVLLIWKGFKNRKKILTPYERSRQLLESLRTVPWTDVVQMRVYPFEIKEALRSYLLAAVRIGSPELTTREWRACLEASPLVSDLADETARLFDAGDRAQFALEISDERKFRADVEDALKLLDALRERFTREEARKKRRQTKVKPVSTSEARA